MNRTTLIHRIVLAAAMVTVCATLAGARVIASPPAATAPLPVAYDASLGELALYDAFMDRHPALNLELMRNPYLANDPIFLARNPEFREFLWRHPGVRYQMRRDPRGFLWRHRRYERNEWRWHQWREHQWRHDNEWREHEWREHHRGDWNHGRFGFRR